MDNNHHRVGQAALGAFFFYIFLGAHHNSLCPEILFPRGIEQDKDSEGYRLRKEG